MEIKKVGVAGMTGAMGIGIVQVCAQSGYQVLGSSRNAENLNKALSSINSSLTRSVEKARITQQDKEAALSRIKGTTDVKDFRDCDLVIESVVEDIDVKKKLFTELDEICKPDAILATNTSSLPISEIATVIKNPTRFIGIHFMNPVPVMKGVEVIPHKNTKAEVLEASKEFVKKIGKEPCEATDHAGFIVSRLVDALMNEAFYCVMDGNKPAEVDKAIKLCLNHPMGPLELCDLAGADVVMHGLETMYAEFGERLMPAPLLKNMVQAGKLGRKTGRGFYEYPPK
ncbi:MAG: 3-hydroxyacyl-CoA dehydrogenase family protein [Dehalococcoidales bacterium]